MPQLLYVLHNSPVWIGKKWFKKIDSLFRELIWKGKQARIRLGVLQLPTQEGGFALPHPESYFYSTQLQQLLGCGIPKGGTPNGKLLLLSSTHNTIIEALEADAFHDKFPTIKLIIKLWKTVKKKMGYGALTAYSPIWNNHNLQEVLKIGIFREWEKLGLSKLSQLYNDFGLKKFSELVGEFKLPRGSFFLYVRLEHALKAQFKAQTPRWEEMPLFQCIIQITPTRGVISRIYDQLSKSVNSREILLGVKAKWEEEVGGMTQEQWARILELGAQVSVTPSQRLSHLMLLNRAYYTPKRLFKFGRRPNDNCPRCRRTGDLIHMVWRCPKLFRYWEEVTGNLGNIFGTTVANEPLACILGHRRVMGERLSTTLAVTRALFQARKLIALRWQVKEPPTVKDWISTMNETLGRERMVYIKRGNLQEFESMWKMWIEKVKSH